MLPIGFDLGQLLVGLAHAGETDPDELAAIDAAIMPAYLEGLADEDYHVDPRLVRTGYLGGLTVRSALCAFPLERLSEGDLTDEQLAVFATRMRLTRVMVDLAREVEPGVLAEMPAGCNHLCPRLSCHMTPRPIRLVAGCRLGCRAGQERWLLAVRTDWAECTCSRPAMARRGCVRQARPRRWRLAPT